MKIIQQSLSALALFLALFGTINAHAQPTHIQLVFSNHKQPAQGVTLTYEQAPRLDQVLTDIEQQATRLYFSSGYGEGYKLFYRDSEKQNAVDARYQRVINTLNQLIQDDDYAHIASLLLQQVAEFQYAPRAIINLDADAVRLRPTLNPRLPGDYLLQIEERPATIRLAGLTHTGEVMFRSKLTVRDYVSRSKLVSGANRDKVWIIEPNGKSRQVGYAYWNNEQTQLMPGAIVFVGFASDDDAQLQQLEHDIITLFSMIKKHQ